MQAIIIDSETGIDSKVMVDALKLSYLIANSILVAGEPASYLTYHQISKKLTTLQKAAIYLKFSKASFNNGETEIEGFIKGAKGLCEFLLKNDKTKHHNTKTFVVYKKAEKAFLDVYMNIVEQSYNDIIKDFGYNDISSLVDNKIITPTFLELSTLGNAWKKLSDETIAEKFLQLISSTQKGEEPKVMILQEGFFTTNEEGLDSHFTAHSFSNENRTEAEFANNQTAKDALHDEPVINESNEALRRTMSFIKLIQFPYLYGFTAAELKALRSQLGSTITLINDKLNLFAKTTFDSLDFTNLRREFVVEYTELANLINEDIARNEFINRATKFAFNTKSSVDVLFGFMLFSDYIMLLATRGIISYQLSELLLRKIAHGKDIQKYPTYIPVITSTSKPIIEENEDIATIKAASMIKKKSISLD